MNKYITLEGRGSYRLVGYTVSGMYKVYSLLEGKYLAVGPAALDKLVSSGEVVNCVKRESQDAAKGLDEFPYQDVESTKRDMRKKLFKLSTTLNFEPQVGEERKTRFRTVLMIAGEVQNEGEKVLLVITGDGRVRELKESELVSSIIGENGVVGDKWELKNFKISGGHISALRGSFPKLERVEKKKVVKKEKKNVVETPITLDDTEVEDENTVVVETETSTKIDSTVEFNHKQHLVKVISRFRNAVLLWGDLRGYRVDTSLGAQNVKVTQRLKKLDKDMGIYIREYAEKEEHLKQMLDVIGGVTTREEKITYIWLTVFYDVVIKGEPLYSTHSVARERRKNKDNSDWVDGVKGDIILKTPKVIPYIGADKCLVNSIFLPGSAAVVAEKLRSSTDPSLQDIGLYLEVLKSELDLLAQYKKRKNVDLMKQKDIKIYGVVRKRGHFNITPGLAGVYLDCLQGKSNLEERAGIVGNIGRMHTERMKEVATQFTPFAQYMTRQTTLSKMTSTGKQKTQVYTLEHRTVEGMLKQGFSPIDLTSANLGAEKGKLKYIWEDVPKNLVDVLSPLTNSLGEKLICANIIRILNRVPEIEGADDWLESIIGGTETTKSLRVVSEGVDELDLWKVCDRLTTSERLYIGLGMLMLRMFKSKAVDEVELHNPLVLSVLHMEFPFMHILPKLELSKKTIEETRRWYESGMRFKSKQLVKGKSWVHEGKIPTELGDKLREILQHNVMSDLDVDDILKELRFTTDHEELDYRSHSLCRRVY